MSSKEGRDKKIGYPGARSKPDVPMHVCTRYRRTWPLVACARVPAPPGPFFSRKPVLHHRKNSKKVGPSMLTLVQRVSGRLPTNGAQPLSEP